MMPASSIGSIVLRTVVIMALMRSVCPFRVHCAKWEGRQQGYTTVVKNNPKTRRVGMTCITKHNVAGQDENLET